MKERGWGYERLCYGYRNPDDCHRQCSSSVVCAFALDDISAVSLSRSTLYPTRLYTKVVYVMMSMSGYGSFCVIGLLCRGITAVHLEAFEWKSSGVIVEMQEEYLLLVLELSASSTQAL
ncbi:unnamed protein product [Cylicostephanus goldi]|uniref:Uncharacterized protein n=1 Tax=Cylicostephanus goldi TaxID=71465 RepID=A0A3P6QLH3_CYLGO|nr:unnamed protein product [Cylicostephanus goldi]